MFLYEIIYVCQDRKQWTCVRAENVNQAMDKVEDHEAGNWVRVLSAEKTFAADASALIS